MQSKIIQTLASLTLATLGLGFAAQSSAGEPAHATKVNLVNPAFGNYAVTEEGNGKWQVCWQGQTDAQRFNGRVSSANGSQIETVSKVRGLAIAQVAPNQVTFDAATDAHEKQCFGVIVHGDHDQVRVDLAVNGVEATNPYLLFASDEALPSADVLAALQY